MRSPSTLAVCTASGIRLTESPSSDLFDDDTFDDEAEELKAVLDSTLPAEVSSPVEALELTVSEELLTTVELTTLLELTEL